jgi:hypothetical protein
MRTNSHSTSHKIQLLNELTDFLETLYEYYAIIGHIHFNFLQSVKTTWQLCKLVGWDCHLSWVPEMMCINRSLKNIQFLLRFIFLRGGGR